MIKRIRKVIILTLIIALFEVGATITIFTFYFYDILGFGSKITLTWVFLATIVSLAFNTIIGIICFYYISKKRSEMDLTVEKMFSRNVEDSLNFSGLGIVATDDSNIIIWVNQIINDVDQNLIDNNILDIFPALRNIIGASGDVTQDITFKDKVFNVSYLKEPNIYLFKDVTEFRAHVESSKQKEMVIGIVQIDNLADFIGGENSDDNDVVASVRTEINKYFNSKGVLLRRFKSDSYFLVCNFYSLTALEDDSFSILDDVKKFTNENGFSLTLSIGIAHDYDGPNKLNERALDALDMAISRGGDQVVIDQKDNDLLFLGGKSEAVEKKNKVKVRLYANSLISSLKSSKSEIFIMGHANADMDALGASLGILAICESIGKKARIIFDRNLVEDKAGIAAMSSFTKDEFANKFVTSREALEKVNSGTILVCVDFNSQDQAMSKDLLENISKVLVIDHHRTNDRKIEKPMFSYIEPSASSACELITELISYAPINPPINLPQKYATIMLSGIFLDTTFFKSTTTGSRTFEACMILRRFGADNSLADDYLKDNFEERELIINILQTLKMPFPGIAYCVVKDEIVNRAVLAKTSDELLRIKGVNASFTVGKIEENRVGVSARSDGTINVQLIMEGLNGGGHFTKAATSLENYTIEQVSEILLNEVDTKLDQAKSTNID